MTIQTDNPKVVAMTKEETMMSVMMMTTTTWMTEEMIVAEVAKETGQETTMQTPVDSRKNVKK